MKSLSTDAWHWLGRELDARADAGLKAQFWWRDDDATEPSGSLDKLLGLSYEWNIPLALAVIPGRLNPGLAEFLDNRSLASVFQHGFAHRNHASPGQRKLELGGVQTTENIVAGLEQGLRTLQQHFPDRFKPVLVPPWNRIDDRVVARLGDLGFSGISTMKARRQAHPAPGLLQVNAHLDPVNWRHQGGFLGVYPAIAILIQHLIARRNGYRDRDEPTGILTHHLAQNDAVWGFLEDLLRFLSEHRAVTWLDPATIWPPTNTTRETPCD